MTFNREARARFLDFAASAPWPRNFRDLGGAVVRMATLAPSGRIDTATVDDEVARLEATWAALGARPSEPGAPPPDAAVRALVGDLPLDRFDAVQLADVLAVCRASRSLSEAGRALFAASRASRSSVNDADRLRKYLARFGLNWDGVRAPDSPLR